MPISYYKHYTNYISCTPFTYAHDQFEISTVSNSTVTDATTSKMKRYSTTTDGQAAFASLQEPYRRVSQKKSCK